MGIDYKKKGDNGPLYNPERDYAYITPTLMCTAIQNLDAAVASPEELAWREQHDITDAAIAKIAVALAEAQRDFVNATDPVASLEQALQRHNFYDATLPLRQLLFSSIGFVFCAAWFKAVREVSLVGEDSPTGGDMARFAATVHEFSRRAGFPVYDVNYMAEHLRLRNDVLQARINELGNQIKALTYELNTALKSRMQPKKTLLDKVLQFFKKDR
jgi:hypothetical protein